MSFLTIDTETKLPIINRNAEIFAFEEFLTILRRKNPCDGDSDGRKKLMNLKEFCYIWFFGDPNSYGVKNGYSDKDLDSEARKLYDIPSSWKADKDVNIAIDKYREINESLSVRIYNTLAKSFNRVDKVANKLIDMIDNELNKNVTDIDETSIARVISMQKELLTMVDSIPKKLKDLKEAENLVRQEMDASEEIRGGGKLRKSYDD